MLIRVICQIHACVRNCTRMKLLLISTANKAAMLRTRARRAALWA
ncbi:hypothetical protein OSH93_10150 [Mycobacterium ulcerans]|nr:hypothetical protein [Mycobacterium ulcerans]MEB3968637.1 hypothetical protein [Mycobacterium ulcerans]MEB3976811.1 hypothetical protein [Mycobacterium ulcerans]MEB4006171.1 hypothetical protein [Mycobacterium ulcerans]MEB4415681.1 hypothetical protein [Mycobacterium ulcerans]MEB4433903.1 hypothetical protein [Mycobacterium ulcerans]